MTQDKKRILILGGGFAGVYAALHLEKGLGRDAGVEITLVSDENFLLFTPMLPEVASSSIEARHIVSPIRAFFRRVQYLNSEVRKVDLQRRRVSVSHCPACRVQDLRFDYLILALGAKTNYYNLPGVAEHSLPMKMLADAMSLRNHVIDLLEHVDMEPDPEMRRAMLTFVVAGGGFAGAETIAELRDFFVTACRFYSRIRAEDFRVLLVHRGPRILPEISEDLAAYAHKKLQQRGVEIRLDTGVATAGAGWVELTTGERVPTRTLVWAAGISPNPLLAKLPVPRSARGNVVVNRRLEVPECPGVWAIGDCAEIPGQDGQAVPPTAQHAVREGKVVAQNVIAALAGRARKEFAYKPLGVLASLGRRSAVAEICGFKFSGFFAWWLWRTIYLFKLPGLERKTRVALDWTLDLFFPRDIVLLKLFTKGARVVAAEDPPPAHIAAHN